MKPDFDLIGVGIGPFNLSLAALLDKVPEVKAHFFEKKEAFSWHAEIMFKDSVMQTSFLKDLVTPVDPTNPHSFLNYLVQHGLFYAHLNTLRSAVTRREFELYCQWVCENLKSKLSFDEAITEVKFEKELFHVTSSGKTYTSKNICIGTGLSPWVPEFAIPHISENCLHAKSPRLADLDLTGKKVAVIGGGQTGLEVFRNAFNGRWGKTDKVTLISRRHTLEPLDESPFTNEYFSPGYVREFYKIESSSKPAIVHHQRFASDGNTPTYLQDFYNELFFLKHVEKKGEHIRILPQRKLTDMKKAGSGFELQVMNFFNGLEEKLEADVVIFCTGFRNLIPACLKTLQEEINFDDDKRLKLSENFTLDWKHSATNKIYALNFGRHIHGISEPQTSLMAWRSGTIINDLLGKTIYPGVHAAENFAHHGVLNDL